MTDTNDTGLEFVLKDGQDGEEVIAAIVIVIEWNGKKPSGTWYHRLHEYGIYARAGSLFGEMSILQWRASQHGSKKSSSQHGLVLQEGIIAVSSMTLARDIAAWAREEGVEVVQIGHMVISQFTMSEADSETFMRLKKRISKPGPKKVAERGAYVVTCLDEVITFMRDLDSSPTACPSCGGSNILARMGKLPTFHYPDEDEDDFSYWKRTRFAQDHFEIPLMSDQSSDVHLGVPKMVMRDVDMPKIYDLPASMNARMKRDLEYRYHIWDVAWCVGRMSRVRRLDERLLVMTAYAKTGGKGFYSFVSPEDGLDLLDLAIADRELINYME